MFSQRGIEKLAGIILLATVVAVVISLVTYAEPIDTARGEIAETLTEIQEDSELFHISLGFLIFSNLLAIPLAAALYVTFREHDRGLALLGSFGFLASGIIQSASVMFLFALESLAQDFVVGGDETALLLARTVGEMGDMAFPLGAMGIALGVFGYGALVARTEVIPRWMGLIGMISAVIIPLGWLRFHEERLEGIILIGLMGALFFGLMTGFWLVTQGTKRATTS